MKDPARRFSAIRTVCHTGPRSPLLSHGVDQVDLWGFAHLLVIIFIATNCREIVANILKYGVVVRWIPTYKTARDNPVLFSGISLCCLIACATYLLEKKRAAQFVKSLAAVRADGLTPPLNPRHNHLLWSRLQLKPSALARGASGNMFLHSAPPEPPPLRATRMNSSPLNWFDHTDFELTHRSQPQGASNPRPTEVPRLPGSPPGSNEPDHVSLGGVSAEVAANHAVQLKTATTPKPRENNHPKPQINEKRLKQADKPKAHQSDKESDCGNEGEPERATVASLSPEQARMERHQKWLKVLKQIAEEHVEFSHTLQVTGLVIAELVAPFLIVTYSELDPVASMGLLMFSVTLTLKMVSYCHVLHDIRLAKLAGVDLKSVVKRSDEEAEACRRYPASMTFHQFWMFTWMPTLCFQMHFPLKERRSWRKILKTSLQLFLSVITMKVLIEQYMGIILANTFKTDLENVSVTRLTGHLIERSLKLSIPTLYTWLLMFLSFFHYWMLLLAELTRLSDAYFYEDWWNAKGFAEYWRKWNLPVHNFCVRHIYKPLVQRNCPPVFASQIIFLLSAMAHEYLVVAPLRLRWTGLVFAAFLLQTPLAFLTDRYLAESHPTAANVVFWIVFCFTGQPVGVLMFYYLWSMREMQMGSAA